MRFLHPEWAASQGCSKSMNAWMKSIEKEMTRQCEWVHQRRLTRISSRIMFAISLLDAMCGTRTDNSFEEFDEQRALIGVNLRFVFQCGAKFANRLNGKWEKTTANQAINNRITVSCVPYSILSRLHSTVLHTVHIENIIANDIGNDLIYSAISGQILSNQFELTSITLVCPT